MNHPLLRSVNLGFMNESGFNSTTTRAYSGSDMVQQAPETERLKTMIKNKDRIINYVNRKIYFGRADFSANDIPPKFMFLQDIRPIEDDETEERVYWISRMGKQAAVDILSSGRIGSGNMDSILMMDEEDQLEVMQTAVKYAGMLQGGIERINMDLKDDFQQHIMSPELKIPSLKIGENSGTKDIQQPSESKVGGESI